MKWPQIKFGLLAISIFLPVFAQTTEYLKGNVSASSLFRATNWVLTGDTTIYANTTDASFIIREPIDGPYNLRIVGNPTIRAPFGTSSRLASLQIDGNCELSSAVSTNGVFAVSGQTNFNGSFAINAYSFSTRSLRAPHPSNYISINLVRDVTILNQEDALSGARIDISYGGSAQVVAPPPSLYAYPKINLSGPSASASASVTPQFLNISTRGLVSASAGLTAGFVISGTGTKRILIRSAGPVLSRFGVNNAISDPTFEVFDSTGKSIAKNDDWDSSIASSFAVVGAFPFPAGSKDSALAITVGAGASYTVIVNGVGAASGEALVEVYELP